MEYAVIEKNNPNSLHMITWSRERGEKWIREVNLDMFVDKTLTRDSFTVVEYNPKPMKLKTGETLTN